MMLIRCLKFFLGERGELCDEEYNDGDNHDDKADNNNEDEDEDEDDGSGAAAGPKVLVHVDLAKTVCK